MCLEKTNRFNPLIPLMTKPSQSPLETVHKHTAVLAGDMSFPTSQIPGKIQVWLQPLEQLTRICILQKNLQTALVVMARVHDQKP